MQLANVLHVKIVCYAGQLVFTTRAFVTLAKNHKLGKKKHCKGCHKAYI